MEIFGHILKDSEFIGIGPLYRENSKDSLAVQMYNSHRYTFKVHMQHQSIDVFSDYFKPGFKDQWNDPAERKKAEHFFELYKLVKEQTKEFLHGKITTIEVNFKTEINATSEQ